MKEHTDYGKTMKEHMLRLVVPSVLGCVGFGLNYLTVTQAIKPVSVLGVSRSIPPGGRIGEQDLVVVSLPGQAAAMRSNLVPADRRGTVLMRKAARKLEPDQLLLYSDLDDRSETRDVPRHHGVIFISLERVRYRRDLIQAGSRVWFIVKAKDERTPPRIGPFEVLQGPAEWSDEGPRSQHRGVEDLLVVLVDRAEIARADALREAIARDMLREIEVEPQ
jgi:hypothetical protein